MRTTVRGQVRCVKGILENDVGMRVSSALGTWHGLCHYSYKDPFIHARRVAMKFETLMLNSLFAACLVLCASTLGAMLV
jgi:hypothetical protein